MTENYSIGALKSPEDTRDYLIEAIVGEDVGVDLPKKYSTIKDLQPVFNQGSLPTCAACAAACCKEWQEKKDINLDNKFAAMFVYNNRVNKPSMGMFGRDVMRIVKDLGCCREEFYDYDVGVDEPIPQIAVDDALKYRVDGYAQVQTIDGAKESLYNWGPLYISFPVFNYTKQFWNKIGDQKQIGGHAIVVVGWDDENAHFILRNSWGTGWGDKGYTQYPYSQFGKHWEIWTLYDGKSPKPRDPPKKKWLRC